MNEFDALAAYRALGPEYWMYRTMMEREEKAWAQLKRSLDNLDHREPTPYN